MKIATLTPALNAERDIGPCLDAIVRSSLRVDEMLVYDDGSTDGTAELARERGAIVHSNPDAPRGPGVGRNFLSRRTNADILIFVDADVVVRENAIKLILENFRRSPDIAAAFGGYDDTPSGRSAASLYANLRHHHVHQRHAGEAGTFWSGFGAVRREAFLEAGGFDEGLFDRPSIEDVELGARLKAHGWRIVLDGRALATHRKVWTAPQLWKTDIFQRATPWAKLIAEGRAPGALNGAAEERVKAIVAHAVWIAALAAIAWPWSGLVSLFAAVLYYFLNKGLIHLIARRGGLGAAAQGLLLHWLYHLYASVVVGAVVLFCRLKSLLVRSADPERSVS